MKLLPFTKTYDKTCVLDFPGFEPEPGRIYAIIGANGSGKSTFAKILAGVLPADRKGAVSDAASVGYLPQKSYAFRMTTEQNLLLNGSDRAKAAQLMKVMSLGIKQGHTVTVTAEGIHEEAAIAAMDGFFTSNL